MAELGNTKRVYIVTSDGSTYTVLKGEQSNNIDRNVETIDTSSKDSGPWGNAIPGKKSLTASVTVYADNSDAQQLAALKAFYKDENIKVFIGKLGEGDIPAEGEAFDAMITSIGDINDAGAVSTRSMNLLSQGAPTFYPEF